jgi:hypothetical protein
LAPGRINADGKLVVRRRDEYFSQIPYVALRKAADGKTAEEQYVELAFRGTVVDVVHFFYDFSKVSWFDRNGKRVDAEAARKRLANWTPVLVLPQEKEQCYPGPSGELLLECYRPDSLIAVVPEAANMNRIDVSPAEGPVPESPIPTRARVDEKGRVVFRPTCDEVVREQRTKEISGNTETAPKTKTVLSTVMVSKVTISKDELAVEPKYVQFFDTDGNPVEAAAVAQRLAKEATVLISGDDGEKVHAFYLKAVQPGTLVCVLPFRISAAQARMRSMPSPEASKPLPRAPRANPDP